MPRKKKTSKKKEEAPKPTYHKSKNGRYYKKTKLPNGKSQCRFVSKSEAEAGLIGSSAKKTAKKTVTKKSDTTTTEDSE